MDNPSQASQTQQPTNPTPLIVNYSKSRIIPIILGIAAIILISIGAYALGAKQAEAPVLYPDQANPTQSPTPDPTANWKTYKDTGGYFSFSHPNSVKLRFDQRNDFLTNRISNIEIQPDIVADNGLPLVEGRLDEIFSLYISVRDNLMNLTNADLERKLIELSEKESSGLDNSQIKTSLKPYKNNQIDGFLYLIPDETSSPTMITQAHGDKIYEFLYLGAYGGVVSQRSKQLIDQILSTFRFSN